jgi:hypothetical protein
MELRDFERDELATLPWTADTADVRDLDAGFNAFVQHASRHAPDPTLYVTSAANFGTLVPATLHDTDAWVLWLPHLDAIEIDALAHQTPCAIHLRELLKQPCDLCLAWQTPMWCFTVFEETVLPSIRRAREDGYITVIVANDSRVAVRALRIDEDFVFDLAMGSSMLRLDETSPCLDMDGRLVMALKPNTYRTRRLPE